MLEQLFYATRQAQISPKALWCTRSETTAQADNFHDDDDNDELTSRVRVRFALVHCCCLYIFFLRSIFLLCLHILCRRAAYYKNMLTTKLCLSPHKIKIHSEMNENERRRKNEFDEDEE